MNEHNKIGVVVLAAGKGTRLKSTDRPKVMLEIGGKPILEYTIECFEKMGFLKSQIIVVVGFCKEKVIEYFKDRVQYAIQEEQLGTAHAAYVGMKALDKDINDVLVLGGDDGAFYRPESMQQFISEHIKSKAVLSLLTAEVDNPSQFGRIVRYSDEQAEIVEKENLSEEQKSIREISTGTFCFNRDWFESIFPQMPRLKKLEEFALPMALTMARDAKLPYHLMCLSNNSEWFGVNTPDELVEADRRKKLKSV